METPDIPINGCPVLHYGVERREIADISIRTKIFTSNVIVSLLLLMLLTYYMSQYSGNLILDKTKKDVGYSISQLAQNIDSLLSSYEKILDSLYVSTEVQNKLLQNYTSFSEAQEVYDSSIKPYEEWITTSRELLRFTIYTDNPTFQFAQVRFIDDEVKQSAWYRSAQGTDAELVKTWTLSEGDALLHKGVIRLTQRVRIPEAGREVYMTIDVEDYQLRKLISRENDKQRYIIALPDGSIVFDTHQPYRGYSKIDELSFYEQIKSVNEYSALYPEEDQNYLLTSKMLDDRNSVRGLKVIQLMPMDQMMVKVEQIKKLAIMLLIVCSIVSIIVTYLISMSLTKRLMKFSRQMKTIDMENMTSTMEINGRDEIAHLSRQFEQMMSRIHQLVHEVYVSDISRKELELRNKEYELYVLQAQINPHYLFNTLNAIRGSLLEKGDKENAEIIKLLAQSFRRVLNNPSEMTYLEDELDIVDAYLRIQVFRFGSRLQYHIDVPEMFYRVEIPRLSMQTLVENAIIHALEQAEGVITIKISGYVQSAQCVCITLEDDGPGISRSRLDEIVTRMNDSSELVKSKHIGLRNIHQRVQMMYGHEYGLRIESNERQGTQVSLCLPYTSHE